MPTNSSIAQLLLSCEKNGTAPEYAAGRGEHPLIVHRDGGGREVIVISDLHLASGLDTNGRYSGTENFFDDNAFARFIDTKRSEVQDRGGILVINGDLLDYLRITELPDSKNGCEEWSRMLAEIGINKSAKELAQTIDNKREKKFGLKTHDYRSVWRLHRSIKGHPVLFAALARWLGDGKNQLMILKGNHDLEWYWPAVRNALRLALGKMIAGENQEHLNKILLETVLPNLIVIDDIAVIDTDLYIEHGHRYDRLTLVLGKPAQVFNKKTNEKELNIPFGSFFNRYLINRLERAYPYIDNVRPRQNILPLLIRERFPLALKLLFDHAKFLIEILRKNWRYVRFMFSRFFAMLLAVGIPLVLIVILLADQWSHIFGFLSAPSESSSSLLGGILDVVFEGFKYIGGLILSYFLARIVAQLQLSETSSLEESAKEIMNNTDYRFVTMGHTHDPDQFQVDGRWFYNTGTWIPILETSSAELRRDRMFCFLHLRRDDETERLIASSLQRWDDSAGRADVWPIITKR